MTKVMEEKTKEHTPTPWGITYNKTTKKKYVYISKDRLEQLAIVQPTISGDYEANAALIVRAVNSHEALINSIQFALQILNSNDENDAEAMPEVVRKLEKALKQAEEE